MRHLIFTATIFYVLFGINLVQAQEKDNRIVIGAIDSIQSIILNEERKLWVYVPDSGKVDFYGQKQYPVIYLLDGDGHFNSVMAMVQYLSAESMCPQMIIVGIPNTNRFRDLTPTNPIESPIPLPTPVGGGEEFTSFLEKELIPYIESTYPTAPYRMMIGHSLGGLMVINTMLHHSHLFNSFLAIDPSLWWDNNLMARQADSILQHKNFDGKSLYFAMANNGIPEGSDFDALMYDTSEVGLGLRPMLLFKNALESENSNGLRRKFQYYPDDTHQSVPLIAEYDALRFLFEKYAIPISMNYDMREPTYNIDSAIVAHYKGASEVMGYTVLPPENFVNDNAYAMMYNGDMERAFRLFEMNIRNYPNSYNVYDSMGDYYVTKDDDENAIQYFSKVLALKEVKATREKLERLKNK